MFILQINPGEQPPVENPPAAPPVETPPAPPPPQPGMTQEQVQWLLNDWKRLNDETYGLKLDLETQRRIAIATPSAPAGPTGTPPAEDPKFIHSGNLTEHMNKVLDARDEAARKRQVEMHQYQQWEGGQKQQIDAYIGQFKNLYEPNPEKQKLIKDEAIKVAVGLIRDHNWTLQQAVDRALLGAASDKYSPGQGITNSLPGKPEVSTLANAPINGNTNKLLAVQELEQMEKEHKVSPEVYLKKYVEVHGDPAVRKT